jgi:hypothetical protein
MDKLAVGDKVRVFPQNPDHWIKSLFNWIDGRDGVVAEIKTDSTSGKMLYLIRFDESFCQNMIGRNDVSTYYQQNSGGSEWHCHSGDLVKIA